MREIKFRAWIRLTGKMYYTVQAGGYGETVPKIYTVQDGWFNAWADNNSNEGELMQYTGIKDKNGKEIYEGDILKQGALIGFVKWVNGGFWLVNADNRGGELHGNNLVVGSIDFAKSCNVETEVIGNIYENPELIKEPTK